MTELTEADKDLLATELLEWRTVCDNPHWVIPWECQCGYHGGRSDHRPPRPDVLSADNMLRMIEAARKEKDIRLEVTIYESSHDFSERESRAYVVAAFLPSRKYGEAVTDALSLAVALALVAALKKEQSR